MRGQVVVRPEPESTSTVLWTPDPTPRSVRTHRGRVLALGPPARTAGGVEVEPGFAPGDLVQYHWTHLEQAWTNEWDGAPAVWIPQSNVDGVYE